MVYHGPMKSLKGFFLGAVAEAVRETAWFQSAIDLKNALPNGSVEQGEGKMNLNKRILKVSAPRRNRYVTMAALTAELRQLRREMAALRRLMPPAPYFDPDSEWRGDSNDNAA